MCVLPLYSSWAVHLHGSLAQQHKKPKVLGTLHSLVVPFVVRGQGCSDCDALTCTLGWSQTVVLSKKTTVLTTIFTIFLFLIPHVDMGFLTIKAADILTLREKSGPASVIPSTSLRITNYV